VDTVASSVGLVPKLGVVSVEALAPGRIPEIALELALHGCGFLPLPLLRRLFVKLTPSQFGKNSGFLTGALESPKGGVKLLVISDANFGQWYKSRFWPVYRPGTSPTVLMGEKNRRSRRVKQAILAFRL
jgi:hypothetical protein